MAEVRSFSRSSFPTYLRDTRFLANDVGHFSVDVLNATVPIVLAILSVPLGLSNTAIGLIATAYTFANALTQPLFGWLSDRYSLRWLGAVGLMWTAVFYAFSAVSPGWWSIVFLILSALGSAAFHPHGATVASRVPLRVVTTAMAIFFLFGQTGSGLGPLLGGALVQASSRAGLLLLSGITAVSAVWMWRNQPDLHAMVHETHASRRALDVSAVALALFALTLFCRMTVLAMTTTFLPKHLQDLGWTPVSYGLVLSMVMIGSALGNVLGGKLADRLGRKPVLAASLLLAVPPLWLYLNTTGITLFFLLFLVGLTTGAGFAVSVVMAQAMLPARKALASGLVLGFMFASGAVGAAIGGWLSDSVGLAAVLQGMAWVALVGGICALGLPEFIPQDDPI